MGSLVRPNIGFNVKRIAIIGGGPAGVAAAKFLLAENAFDKVDIFEQQAQVGGVSMDLLLPIMSLWGFYTRFYSSYTQV